jgi:tetratricopeptide (TPR) repeat protein
MAQSNQIDKAEALYRRAMLMTPSRHEAGLNLVKILSRRKSDVESRKTLLQLDINLIPAQFKTDYYVERLKSDYFLTKLLTDDAKQNAALALQLSQDEEATLLQVVGVFIDQKNYQQATELLGSLTEEVPGTPLIHALQGEFLTGKLQLHESAITAFSNAIILDSDKSTYFNGRGLAFLGLKKFELALGDFEQATRIDPTDGSARYNLACAFALLGKKTEAIASLSSAISIDSSLRQLAKSDKDFSSIRNESDFLQILEDADEEDQIAH